MMFTLIAAMSMAGSAGVTAGASGMGMLVVALLFMIFIIAACVMFIFRDSAKSRKAFAAAILVSGIANFLMPSEATAV